jgi:hypothetical protein
MIVGHPFTLKFEAAKRWIAQLQEWEIDGFGTYQSPQHYVFAIQRFHTWAYWRPMTVARYERLTMNYEGPHLPIFVSRTEYLRDETMVHEGFEFSMRRYHRYSYRDWYGIIPAFLMQRPWPHERQWRWHPAVRVTKSVLRDVLLLEHTYGGWPVNRRGKIRIPKKTGCSGNKNTDTGWATIGFSSALIARSEQPELFT